jgi:protein AroM
MPSLGVVTIGQSPRADLTGELAAYLPAGTSLLERGALDGLA